MDTTPAWTRGFDAPSYPALDKDVQVDVLIIGAGITGLTCAYLLQKAGVKAAVIDRYRVGAGETSHTTAHLTEVTDTRLSTLVNTFGREHARAVWQAGELAIQTIEQIAHAERIDCRFQRLPGYLVASAEEYEKQGAEQIEAEVRLATELDFDVSFAAKDPLWGRPALVAANQGRFHPIRYLHGLARAVVTGGGLIFENTNAEEFVDGCRRVRANGHQIFFRQVLLATHVPIQGYTSGAAATLFQTKLAAYSTYAVGAYVPVGSIPLALYWDTADPYTYVRVEHAGDRDYVIVGGCDHKTGQVEQTMECYATLDAKLRRLAPAAEVDAHWSGQVIETVDGLPYIGENEERQFVATGFAGNGMTFGTIAGVIVRDAILGVESPWKEVFDPDRKKLSASWDYVKENADYPFYLVRNRLRSSDADAIGEIPAGEGRIVRVNGKKTAVYRSAEGKTTLLSPTCPHMGCIVGWNTSEKTWDCPCHGSRFSATGQVISGPAEEGMRGGST